MPINLLEVVTKSEWEAAVHQFPEANFLQSWNWGVFHQSLRKEVKRFVWVENGRTQAVAELVCERAKRGTYATIAGGPLLDWQNRSLVEQVLGDCAEQAKKWSAHFVRFRPQVKRTKPTLDLLQSYHCTPSPMHVTADLTVQVDLSQPEDAILASFRKSTRYEIRRAEKNGITVRRSQDKNEIHALFQDQLVLAKRHGFVPFSEEFWMKQFEAFVADNQVELFHAELNGQRLASAFVLFYNNEAVYHYGTSTDFNHSQPGSYACQWAIIQAAKERGCTRYNLWGVAPLNQPGHRFAGVTTFKMGFSDQLVEYVPAHDLPLGWQYWPTALFEVVRKKLRKL